MSLDHYTVKDAPEGHKLHHPHELSLCSMVGDGTKRIKCGLCTKDVVDRERSGDLVYVCKSPCGYVLHKSCADLPLQINHSFHPSHGPLSLIYSWNSCFSCFGDKYCLYYKCSKCWFGMDLECALLMTKGEEESIQHITHPHPLLLLLLHDDDDDDDDDDGEGDDDNRVSCFACESKISGGDEAYYYGCTHCNYFLHKSCSPLEFPKHPLHPHHSSLSLFVDYNYGSFTCNICESEEFMRRFHFKCDDHQCSFRMCWKCIITVKKNIKYEDHDHLLCYVDKAEKIDNCNAYDAYCTRPDLININILDSEEFESTEWSMFKCLDCDFRLHFLCGPLPSTIKHHSHIHSLTLLDSLIEDDFGEYYCDVCETQRDPRFRLYHCSDCKYFAHVHCVIFEIAKVVRGDVEGVELNALGNDYWRRRPTELETTSFTLMDLIHQITQEGKNKLIEGVELKALGNDYWRRRPTELETTSFTLRDLIHQITDEDDKSLLKEFYKWDVGIVPPKQREAAILNDDNELYKILQLSRFDATHFQTLMDEFNESIKNEKLELTSSDLGMKMVKVKGYMIPYPLAGVLQTLLDEYGDIRGNYWSLEMKSFCYFILCQTVKRMSATLVKDVTEHLLQQWFLHLRFLRFNDFNTGFARVQFEKVVDAYLGLQAKKLEDEIPKIINAKKDDLQRKIAELQRGLEKCNEYKGSSQKSEYMKYCLEKASQSKWDYSFDCSFKNDARSSSFPRGRFLL